MYGPSVFTFSRKTSEGMSRLRSIGNGFDSQPQNKGLLLLSFKRLPRNTHTSVFGKLKQKIALVFISFLDITPAEGAEHGVVLPAMPDAHTLLVHFVVQ